VSRRFVAVHISFLMWSVSLVGLAALLGVDLLIIGRRPHTPSVRESVSWVAFYVGLAVLFGIGIALGYGGRYGGEFFAGWLTEYSLSVDNLFVFVLIMARFRTPRAYQQKALLIGIGLALVMRGLFIALGSAALNRFEWVFYFFGLFLLYTAINLARSGSGEPADFKENPLIRWARRVMPISREYHEARVVIRRDRRWLFTPMLIVMVALGTTDLIFALDSIPAIFGLTKQPYLVFTANVFALMGLRQLYFLLGNLLDRLVYLSIGLAGILGFIGVKLILEALHGNELPFINGGRSIAWAPHIPIWLSLVVIVGALLVATVASLIKANRDAASAASAPSTPATSAEQSGPFSDPVGRP
jgi:tellurite resistance protein TerC